MATITTITTPSFSTFTSPTTFTVSTPAGPATTTTIDTVFTGTTTTSLETTRTLTTVVSLTSIAPASSLKSSDGSQAQTSGIASHNGTTGHTASCRNLDCGGVAGISAGSAVTAAFLASIIVWLVMRTSYKGQRPNRLEEEHNSFASRQGTGVATSENLVTNETLVEKLSAAATIQNSLPQPEEDQAISGEMSRLRTLIKHHVQSYYHSASLEVSKMTAAKANVTSLGMFTHGQLSTSRLNSLLLNPKTRLATIRYCLAWTMMSRIQFTCPSDISFLPLEVSIWMNTISTVETRDQRELFTVRAPIHTI